MKNKKLIIIISALAILTILFILILGIILKYGFDAKDDNKEIQREETIYTAYVSINPLIKLSFKVSCQADECNEPIITEYELVNEDAKKIYTDIALNGKPLGETIELISKKAAEKNYKFEIVNIYTNWENKAYFDEKNYEYNINVELKSNEELRTLRDDIMRNVEDPSDPIVSKTIEQIAIDIRNIKTLNGLKVRATATWGPNVYWSCPPGESGCIFPNPVTKVTIRGKQSIIDNVVPNIINVENDDEYIEAYINVEGLDEGTYKLDINYECSSNKIEILPHEEQPWIEIVVFNK